MSTNPMVKIFEEMGGDLYDKNNSHFKAIHNNLQFLIKLVLSDLPENARVLCVGVGTGADLIDLATEKQSWSFVGLDPAGPMLKTCEQKLKDKNLSNRCKLFHGYLANYKSDESFDAVLCLYVLHFVKDLQERAQMYRDMSRHLKSSGRLISAEICTEIESPGYPGLLDNWKTLHGLAGSPKEKLADMGKVIEEQLAVLSPEQTREMIVSNGFENPSEFFKSFLITGHWAKRKG